MSPKKRTRWIGYVRVSTQEQADGGVSLDAQRKRIRAWSDLQEIELLEVVADEGVSAKNLDRAGLQRVLQALRSGEADGVVVAKLDRLTRRTRDLLDLVEELCQERGLGLVSINENIDTSTAAGRLVLTVLGALASWEREVIGERTSEALRHLTSTGVRVGRARYGTRYSDDVDGDGHRVVVGVPEQQATIKRARQLRARGATLRAIAAKLTAEGRPTQRGGAWAAKTVRDLLRTARAS